MAAETILLPVAKLILGKAADLASQQIGLLWNFRRELRKLKDTVTRIQAVLRDAEEKQFHSHQVKDWLEKLSDVMYDADDVLDDLATEARKEALLATSTDDDGGKRTTTTTTCWSLVCFLCSALPQQLWYDLKMAHAIKAIRENLDDISKDKETLDLQVDPTGDEALPSRQTDSCPPMIVVGREDDKKKIIQLLLNSNQEANISVVSIVGLGGLGKTTLAQLIFDDDQVEAHFDIKTWVYVSQSFDVNVILEKMLRSIDRQCQADLESDDLQAQLREKIKKKRFLFVLDDVWEEIDKNWEALGKYLTVGALGSKVLVTTRSTRVAEVGRRVLKSRISTSIMESYHLKGLSEEESWTLLVEKSLPENVPQDPQVQEIGKQILKKCHGVPLAVNTIAGVLVDSTNPKIEWQSFLEKSISSIHKEGEEDPTMSTLRLSFNHLPSHMKHCFTYCKLFTRGSELDIQPLVRFWVAQGYVDSEDKGFDCFKTLWCRSFFQGVEMDEWGNMSTCRIHDLMHDLVDTIAGKKIIRSSSSTVLKNIPSKTRHLIISDDDSNDWKEEEYGDDMENASKVRTLICSLSRKEYKQVLDKFLRLRLLMISEEDSDSNGEENSALDASSLLKFVDKLKHLRYLVINCTGKGEISDSVTNLINLQVLHLLECKSLEELPRGIGKLVNLKHLEVDPNELQHLTHMPKGIGKLKFLQTLPLFVVGKKSGSSSNDMMVGAGLDELEGLNALCGELKIKGLSNADSQVKGVYVLKKKLHLRSLLLDWHRDRDCVNNDGVSFLSTHDERILEMLWPHPNLNKLIIHWGYQGMKISNWLSSLTNLVEFSLQGCVQCEYLPSQMHQMSSLKKLTIKYCPMLKGIANDGDDCDSFANNSITRRLSTDEDHGDSSRFDCLSYLGTQNCPRLTRLPMFPTVEGKLELRNVSLAPFARTMKMKMRSGGGGVDYSDDANIHASSSSSSALVHPTLSKLTELSLCDLDDDIESLYHHDPSSCLVSLQVLTIERCKRGVKLPGSLCSSIYLTEIDIRHCGEVEYLPALHELPSLNKLIIMDCPKLKECLWKKTKKKKKQGTGDEWPHFPCLSTLEIRRCPKLTRMPLFPTVEGELKLSGTSAEAVVRTMKMKVVSLVTPPLSKLSRLNLGNLCDLESLPEEGLRNLTSLWELSISECPRLASLPPAMRHLTFLQKLKINYCPLLRQRCESGEGEDWPNISHIPYIRLNGASPFSVPYV